MEEQLISFNTAKLAKEKGFNIDTVTLAFINYYSESFKGDRKYVITVYSRGVYYGDNPIYLAPTQSLLQRWLRDSYSIHLYIVPYGGGKGWCIANIRDVEFDTLLYPARKNFREVIYITYEQALEAGLIEALKLI
jgi:hypothetical protein